MTGYLRKLGAFDATMVVVGGIIGAGIFLNPAIVAQRVEGEGSILLAWAVGGAVALLGALCFAELGARRPLAGGGYIYLREAFGPLPAFLYGWTQLVVIISGGIAAVAVTFARYAAGLGRVPAAWETPLAVGAILLLTGVNILGVRQGSWTQNLFTLLKLAALGILIAGGLLLAPAPAGGAQAAPVEGDGGSPLLAFGAALVPVLFAYGGWQHANNLAGEVRTPARTLPVALLGGVGIVVAVYLLANLACLRALGAEGLAASAAPAADAMRAVAGEWGVTVISAGVALSTFGILNLFIMAAPRIYQAMAADGLFFASLARLHPQRRTPDRALLLQAGWAITLALTGTYGELLDWVVFGDWIFFGAVGAALLVDRRRAGAPSKEGGSFRVPLHPVVPVLFVLASLLALAGSVASNPRNALLGAAIIALGVPAHRLWRSSKPPIL